MRFCDGAVAVAANADGAAAPLARLADRSQLQPYTTTRTVLHMPARSTRISTSPAGAVGCGRVASHALPSLDEYTSACMGLSAASAMLCRLQGLCCQQHT
jgi:hypothetical protein